MQSASVAGRRPSAEAVSESVCAKLLALRAQLSDEGRLLYELEYVTVERKAKLSIRPPGTAPGARASFVVKALLGDGTGQLRVAPDTNMLLLGPLEDAPEMCVSAACGDMCCQWCGCVWLAAWHVVTLLHAPRFVVMLTRHRPQVPRGDYGERRR